MKTVITTAVLFLSSAALSIAQTTAAPNPQVMGRGRGGTPYAWNDQNKDGICDLTGKPVGQGGPCGMRRGRRGRGAAAWGRGMGRGFWGGQPPAPAPQTQPQK